MDDDLKQRLDAISAPELRRRIDLSVRYVRELRRSIAVSAGMAAENAPSPVPFPDPEKAKQTLEELMAMLPLLRRSPTPEERARRRPRRPEDRAAEEELLAQVEADPEAFDAAAEESRSALRAADIPLLRARGEKIDMLEDLRKEAALLVEELEAHVAQAAAQVEAVVARFASQGGEG
jgi:hypothetical protein